MFLSSAAHAATPGHASFWCVFVISVVPSMCHLVLGLARCYCCFNIRLCSDTATFATLSPYLQCSFHAMVHGADTAAALGSSKPEQCRCDISINALACAGGRASPDGVLVRMLLSQGRQPPACGSPASSALKSGKHSCTLCLTRSFPLNEPAFCALHAQ